MNLSAKQYREIVHAPAKPSKYRAVPAYRCRACGCEMVAGSDDPAGLPCPHCSEDDAIRFASQAEARRYDALRQEERLGLIKNLRLQVKYPLHHNGTWICDYICDADYSREGVPVVEDTKGVRTREFRIKARMFKAQYGFSITEVNA